MRSIDDDNVSGDHWELTRSQGTTSAAVAFVDASVVVAAADTDAEAVDAASNEKRWNFDQSVRID